MSRERTVGVVGGYGATGTEVARELLRSTDCEVVVAGRDLSKAERLARSLGARAAARRVDVYAPDTLADLCARCRIVINCAGPSCDIQDSVAQVARRHGCHYIDPGGFDLLLDKLAPYADELRRRGLIFLSSAGWIPGLSEVFVHFADAKAAASFDTIESVEMFYGDRNEWSLTGVADMIWHVRQYGETGYFRRGRWTPVRPLARPSVFDFPAPVGRQLVFPHYKCELERFAARRKYPLVGNYVGLLGPRTLLLIYYIRYFMKNRRREAVLRLSEALRRDYERAGRGGVVAVAVRGTKDKCPARLTATLLERRHYWVTGVVPATAARLILERRITAAGCNYLCDAVDPSDFMREMVGLGVEYHVECDPRGETDD